MTKWALAQECKDSLVSTNQCNTPHSQTENKNHTIISIDAKKPLTKFNIHL